MANIRVIQSPYVGPFANIEAVAEASTGSGIGIHLGELGGRVELTQTGSGTKEYQKVQLDSGCVAASPAGAPTTGELVYWKLVGAGGATGKSKYLVTNDSSQAVGGSTTHGWRNEVAGVLVTPQATLTSNLGLAPFIWIQQKGNCATVKIASGSPNPGDQLQSDTSATAAQGVIAAANTQTTVQALGKFTTAAVTVTTAPVDLDIPGIP